MNKDASVIDDQTKFVRVPSGKAKDVIVSTDITGKTVLQFVAYKKVTGNHVDEMGVISKLTFNNF